MYVSKLLRDKPLVLNHLCSYLKIRSIADTELHHFRLIGTNHLIKQIKKDEPGLDAYYGNNIYFTCLRNPHHM